VSYNQNSRLTLTFSDTKIIYPSIENPSFFSYYIMNSTLNNNKNIKQLDMNMKLENLF